VGRSPYQSEKRRKELARLKKQEEKRQRRFNKNKEGAAGEDSPDGAVPGDGTAADPQAVDQTPAGTTDSPEATPREPQGNQGAGPQS
jgi:hypothetical protein